MPPYPLFHADAYNVLAQIERDAERKTEAIAAATRPFAFPFALFGLLALWSVSHARRAPKAFISTA